jgi:hypothetical protein
MTSEKATNLKSQQNFARTIWSMTSQQLITNEQLTRRCVKKNDSVDWRRAALNWTTFSNRTIAE